MVVFLFSRGKKSDESGDEESDHRGVSRGRRRGSHLQAVGGHEGFYDDPHHDGFYVVELSISAKFPMVFSSSIHCPEVRPTPSSQWTVSGRSGVSGFWRRGG